MEPEESAQTKGEGENDTTKPKIIEASPAPGEEDPEFRHGKEVTAGDISAVNGREQDMSRVPASVNDEESALKASTGNELQDPVPTLPEEGQSKEREKLLREDIPSGGATYLPSTPVSSSADASASGSCGPTKQAAEAPKARSSPANQPEPPDFYCVKWINWKGERTPIITQSENGPCPLLAIMNILFLQWKVRESLDI